MSDVAGAASGVLRWAGPGSPPCWSMRIPAAAFDGLGVMCGAEPPAVPVGEFSRGYGRARCGGPLGVGGSRMRLRVGACSRIGWARPMMFDVAHPIRTPERSWGQR